MAKQRADKMIDEMRESFVNMSEEELDELAQAIREIASEKE